MLVLGTHSAQVLHLFHVHFSTHVLRLLRVHQAKHVDTRVVGPIEVEEIVHDSQPRQLFQVHLLLHECGLPPHQALHFARAFVDKH